MSNYRINHACGHTVDHNLTGPTSRREWLAASMANDNCAECKRAEANVKAASNNQEAGLPPLEGSEKQVNWAESLRAKRVKQLATLREDYADAKSRNSEAGDRRADRYETQIKAIEGLLASTSAKAFIDANQNWEF